MQEVLKKIKEVRGVRAVALLSEDGFVVEELKEEGTPEATVLSAQAATVLGTAQALAQSLGEETEEVMVEYPEGTLLLVPLAGHHLLLFLEDVQSLGRARLALRRVLPEIKEALT